MKKIIFFCGEICSGKSTIAKQYAKDNDYTFVEVSDLVKSILNERINNRSAMQGHPELAESLAASIYNALSDSENGVVVSGARQLSIIQLLECLSEVEFEYKWIHVDKNIRLERYLNRKRDIDSSAMTEEDFKIAESHDNALGLQEIKEYFKNK